MLDDVEVAVNRISAAKCQEEAALRRSTVSDRIDRMQKPNRGRMSVDSPQDGIYHLLLL
jgi:hypothetical protein